MPIFHVWCDHRHAGLDDAEEIRADDHQAAAEAFAEKSDAEGDYTIVWSGEARVRVRKDGDSEWIDFDVFGEEIPQYRARPVTTEEIP